MLSQDYEDEIRSRFGFKLAIWLWQDELNPRVRCAFGNVLGNGPQDLWVPLAAWFFSVCLLSSKGGPAQKQVSMTFTHTHLFNNQSFKMSICFFAKVGEHSWGCPSVSHPRPTSWGWRPLQWLGGESRWQKVKVAEYEGLSLFLMRENMAWGDEQVTDRDFHYF